jgi:hypothetical protein
LNNLGKNLIDDEDVDESYLQKALNDGDDVY